MTPDAIDVRLRALETNMAVFHEKWDGHSQRSEMHWKNLKDNSERITQDINGIYKWLQALPCAAREENTKSIWRNINSLWKVVGVVAMALLGVVVKSIFG